MEQDCYQQSHHLYIIGMLFFILSLALFAFTAFILPYLLLKWRYDVPEFIIYTQQWLQTQHNMTDREASLLILIFFLALSIAVTLIAFAASKKLDSQIYAEKIPDENKPARVSDDTRETVSVLSKIVLIVILVFIGAILFEWMIYIPPPK